VYATDQSDDIVHERCSVGQLLVVPEYARSTNHPRQSRCLTQFYVKELLLVWYGTDNTNSIIRTHVFQVVLDE